MSLFSRHWPRIAVTLIPLVFALMHALGVMPIGVLQQLDDIIYDARLRWTMPRTLDERIVIVDIDEQSLAEVGRWPWGRNRLAELVDKLFDRQKVALAGFDVVFAEPDESSGLKLLRRLAQAELKEQAGFAEKLNQLQATLDYDSVFAKSLRPRPVVLGYYFTSDREGRTSGVLPQPLMRKESLLGRPISITSWNGYGANIEQLAQVAPVSGFFNQIVDSDGVLRSIPLLAEHGDRYYESLALAMFRSLVGMPSVEPPVAPLSRLEEATSSELKVWAAFLKAYRSQGWDQCDVLMLNLQRLNPKKYLYEMYSKRVASFRETPLDPAWDGATNFETK